MEERREPFGGFVVVKGTREQYEEVKHPGAIVFYESDLNDSENQ